MNLDQLKVFVTIVETGSFRGAADKLHRAQSAVSYGVKTLEEELGFEILDRSQYRPVLSEKGQALFQRAKGLLAQAEKLQSYCRDLAGGMEHEIRLSISFICPLAPVIEVLQAFSDRYPETNLNLAVTHMDRPIRDLIAEETDLAISDLFEWDERLMTHLWRKVVLIPVASPQHPLAQRPDLDQFEALQQYTQIIVSTTARPEDGRSAGLIRGGKQWVVTQFPTKIALLKASLGWGFMPDHLIEGELRSGTLSKLRQIDPIEREFFICRLKSASLGPAGTFIWDSLTK